MKLMHAALVCSTENKADRFFADLLGFKKSEPKILFRELSQALFGVDEDLTIIKYLDEKMVLEILIHQAGAAPPARLAHLCIEVEDPDALLTRCRDRGVEIRQVHKGDKIITFIADDDGNLFELV